MIGIVRRLRGWRSWAVEPDRVSFGLMRSSPGEELDSGIAVFWKKSRTHHISSLTNV